jgi:hypothetical protein
MAALSEYNAALLFLVNRHWNWIYGTDASVWRYDLRPAPTLEVLPSSPPTIDGRAPGVSAGVVRDNKAA